MRKGYIFAAIAMLAAMMSALIPASAYTMAEKDTLIARLTRELPSKTTARDSLRIYYDIFDLGTKSMQKQVVWQIYETAGNAQDLSAQLDMLRNMSVLYAKNDSLIDELMKIADKIPNESARESTQLFIRSQWLNQQVTRKDERAMEEMLLKLITDTRPREDDTEYDKMLHLLAITQFLGGYTDGVMFQESLEKYANMIDALPESDYPLKNQFNTTCAILYSKTGQPEKAVASDRKLLDIIDNLQKMYRKKKRNYRNYDVSKFICYRRMLSNYSALSPEEIELIHDSIMIFRERNSDVRSDMDKHGRAEAYYLMATKQYEKAIPAIKKTLSTDIPQYQRIKFYRMLRDAAKATGNKPVLLEALEGYDFYLEDVDSIRRAALVRERKLRQQLTDSLEAPVRLTAEQLEAKLRKAENTKTTLWVVSGILAVLLILYMSLYFRQRMARK